MTTFHRLSPALFDTVAGSGGGPAAIDELRAAQVSKHLLLIGHLLENWPGDPAEAAAVADALERARDAAPAEFRAVVGAPLVGGWAAIATRALLAGRAGSADFRHLGAVAMVACAAAGVDGSSPVPVHDGLAVLPGLGAAEVGDVEAAEAVAEGGRLVVHGVRRAGATTVRIPVDPTTAAAGWQPVRRLRAASAGQVIDLELDDLHPYRHGHHVPPATRLPDGEVERWRTRFAAAWQLLTERRPERAAELRVGLRTLVPLVQLDPRSARSATIRHAFGVFGLTLPPSPADFAVTLVHEFQHSKLSAVLDLVPLTDPAGTGRYFAPWRTDPRPLAGLLQGVYAFAGVADIWRGLRGADRVGPVADIRFAEARLQVDRGLTSIERSGALTPAGERLAAGLRAATDDMLAEPVPAAVARTAADTLDRLRAAWVEHNGAEP
jgi:HEXXH motif-containing protein